MNCKINQKSKFDRKNYFYPDLPKGYQISQYDKPIGEHGYVEIEVNGETKRIGIMRVHLEEDAGKSMHAADGSHTLVDYNRTGVPLIEIVSEPDIRSPEEARLYLEALKSIMQYCDVSDCRMEEGSLRCDANISLRPVGSTTFGNKVGVEEHELVPQRAARARVRGRAAVASMLRQNGEPVLQETRRFDEATQTTVSMRPKEEAHDYRYFPRTGSRSISTSMMRGSARCATTLPELPFAKRPQVRGGTTACRRTTPACSPPIAEWPRTSSVVAAGADSEDRRPTG